MKKAMLTSFLVAIAWGLYGQGQIVLCNLANDSTNPLATSRGLVWLATGGSPALINEDFNLAFYVGTDSNNLAPLATLLLSNGTATGDNGFSPGTFIDPSTRTYTIQGATISAYFQIQAWTGNFDSYAAAVNGRAAAAQTPVFVNIVSEPPGTPPDFTGMPAMVLSGIPEPSTFALAALGGVSALLVRRWRK